MQKFNISWQFFVLEAVTANVAFPQKVGLLPRADIAPQIKTHPPPHRLGAPGQNTSNNLYPHLYFFPLLASKNLRKLRL